MKKNVRFYNINVMDIEPIDVSSAIQVFDTFATVVIKLGASDITLFFNNEDDAKEARCRLTGMLA